MLSYKREETDEFDAVYKLLQDQLRVKLTNFDTEMAELKQEFKIPPAEFKEITAELDGRYKEITTKIQEFNKAAESTKKKLTDLQQELKEKTDLAIKNQEAKAHFYFREGLSEAVKVSFKEYNRQRLKHDYTTISELSAELNRQIKSLSAQTSHLEITTVINKVFSKLFSNFQKGSHPFVKILDQNISKLALPQGMYGIDSGSVFEITGGTLVARSLTWNKAGQSSFVKKCLQQEMKSIDNVVVKKRDAVTVEGFSALRSKCTDAVKSLTSAEELIDVKRQAIIKVVIREATKARDQFFMEAKQSLMQMTPMKDSASEEKNKHSNYAHIFRVVSELTQMDVAEANVVVTAIMKLLSTSERQLNEFEQELSGKQKDIAKIATVAAKKIDAVVASIAEVGLSIDNCRALDAKLEKARADIQREMKPVIHLNFDYEKSAKNVVKLLNKKFMPVMDSLKKVSQVLKIIRDQVNALRKKPVTLFKTHPVDKADRIDLAIRMALENFDVIFQHNNNDRDRIQYFLNFKKDKNHPSIKEALNEKRSLFAKPKMYERILKLIEEMLVSEDLAFNASMKP